MAKTRILPIPLGGGGGECNLQQKTATPTTSTQTVRPDAGYDGMSRVTIEGVDANIDQNITPENIKDGVEILGVTGTYEGEGGQCNLEQGKIINQNGTYDAQLDGYDGYGEIVVDVQGGCNLENGKTITQNGYYDAQSDGYDGFDAVDVLVQPNVGSLFVVPQVMQQTFNASSDGYDGYDTVDVAGMNLQSKTITQNGTYDAQSDGYDGYSYVDVDVQPNVGYKLITQNGYYNAQSDDGWDGYSEVDVQVTPNISHGDVFTPSTQQQQITAPMATDGYNDFTIEAVDANIDANIQAGNIKDGVTILGVTGTYTGGGSVDYNELCFTANEANCTVEIENSGTNAPVMYYSTDGRQTWALWDYSTITLQNAGDKVYFYGNNPNGFSTSDNDTSMFVTSGDLSVSGNIMTLLTRDGSMTTIPSNDCFTYLFSDTSITSADDLELPATTLANNCYCGMFDGCASLVSVPELPATTMAQCCYYGMFQGCASLVNAPELPATTLAHQCYDYMFYECTSLVTAPELPATTLADWCYEYMFYGCTSLVSAPELPATTLVNNCYDSMFEDCSNLNYVKVGATFWDENYANNWLNNVSPTGTFVKPFELVVGTGTGEIPSDNPNGIPVGWTVKIGDLDKHALCFTAEAANVDISISRSDTFTLPTLYITTDDGATWTQMQLQTSYRIKNIGDKAYVYGNNTALSTDMTHYLYFSTSGLFSISGNLTTLLNPNGTTTLPDYAFNGLFINNTRLIKADLTIPVTSVGLRSLYGTFEGCSQMVECNLELSATTLGDNCYGRMFYGCTRLRNTPTTLPAMTLTDACYNDMFSDCTSITTAPELPATTLATNCYAGMFHNCDALVNAPATLPATATASNCYDGMFNLCENLEKAPEIFSNTFDSNMHYMFRQCHSLNYIKVHCTTWDTSNDTKWVENVGASGTFEKPSGTTVPTGTNGVPTGWTVVDF